MTRKRTVVVIAAAVIAAAAALLFVYQQYFGPESSSNRAGVVAPAESNPAAVSNAAIELIVPWGIAVLPDGGMLVTERPGTLRHIGQNSQSYTIEGVSHVGEGGLLGIALHPDFATNNQIFLYLTTKTGKSLTNRIERYNYDGLSLSDRQLILTNIPGEENHDGGRIAFGPDGFLYVTVGDAGRPEDAQDKQSLAGKILRLTPDGQPAPGNPFGSLVYSYGHRNPQGLAWDSKGQLWETEHGRSGMGTTGYDELNLIKPGGNYGWPDIEGDETREGVTGPVTHSGSKETWAPGGLAYAPAGTAGGEGSLYFGGLRGQSLYQATIKSDNTVSLTAHFRETYGRLRTTVIEGDTLYLTTSNLDGRGESRPEDDKILRIKLSAL